MYKVTQLAGQGGGSACVFRIFKFQQVSLRFLQQLEQLRDRKSWKIEVRLSKLVVLAKG